MPICKFFQTGNCRFGTKCANEHFEVKQIIKSEVDAAIQGNQWPLSCFGPFKEKPCIPNFINDQSFEEIKFLCYEAKKQNCFPAYQQQFTQQVLEAQNKMKALLSLNREVIDVVTQVHDGSESTQTPQTQSSNPFAMSGGGANANNSIFGGGNAASSNPFGNKAPTLGSTGGSIFGGGTPAAPSTAGGGLFGGQSGFGGAGGGSVFGSQTTTQPSIFSQQQTQPQQTSVFSLNQLGTTAPTNTNANIFGMQQQPLEGQHNSIFGAAQTNQSTFGGGASVFGGNQQSGGSIFAQNPPAAPTNVFAQAVQQQPAANPSFGGGGFLQPTFAAASQPQANVYGNPNVFGQAQQPTSNAFTTPQQQQQQPTNIFATAVAQTQQNSGFGTSAPIQPTQQGIFGQQPATQINPNIPDTVFSNIAILTADQIEAFKAERFSIANIPLLPPPRELC